MGESKKRAKLVYLVGVLTPDLRHFNLQMRFDPICAGNLSQHVRPDYFQQILRRNLHQSSISERSHLPLTFPVSPSGPNRQKQPSGDAAVHPLTDPSI